MKINPLTDRHYNMQTTCTGMWDEDLWSDARKSTYGPRTVPISEEEAMRILSEKKNHMSDNEYEKLIMSCYDSEVPGGSTPSQYALPEGAKELQDLIEYRKMNFALGNIFKACYRIGTCSHSDTVRDLNKIKWFVERLLNEHTK